MAVCLAACALVARLVLRDFGTEERDWGTGGGGGAQLEEVAVMNQKPKKPTRDCLPARLAVAMSPNASEFKLTESLKLRRYCPERDRPKLEPF